MKFNDGSAYYSVIGQIAAAQWKGTMAGFIKSGTTTFSKSFYFDVSGYTYKLAGDISASTPTFTANLDNNGNLNDTTAKTFTLTAQ